MGYIIAAGFGLIYTVLILTLYDEIMNNETDIYDQDFVYMDDGTPVEYNEDEQE